MKLPKSIISDRLPIIEPICPNTKDHKIVERLKKQIENDVRFCHSLAINYRHYEILKKILKEEKNE